MVIDFNELAKKKFKFINAEVVEGQIVLTLQYGSQLGQISIDANYEYQPPELYRFTELLDQLIASVSLNMYNLEAEQDKSMLDSLTLNRIKGGPNG